MRLLVTNDDGVHAPGLHALARALVDAGHDVTVAAPLDDRSGSGAALGPVHMGEGIAVEQFALEDVVDAPAYGVDGPPALSVMVALLGAFGDPPDAVVSGVNPGPNTGRSVLFSGTVGAAMAAANLGLSAVAVSQVHGDPWLLDTAASFAVGAVAWLESQPSKTVLNVNVPNASLDDIAGVRWGRLATFGIVRTALASSVNGRLQIELRATDEELEPDSDTMLVQAGYVSVTSLVGITAAPESDVGGALERAVLSRQRHDASLTNERGT